MKDYLVYQMMADMGVASPLCSYVYITVNGQDWGLYLAVEGVEESFLQRNYGKDYGELYKPDSMSMGGGRGNGENFNMDNFFDGVKSGRADNSDVSQEPHDNTAPAVPQMPDGGNMPGSTGGMNHGKDDVLLKYIDDEIESYSNIFENAKTDISDSDKTRLIEALKKLSVGEDLSDTVNIEAVIRYFVVHNFVLNFDSYTGSMIHNYYLYEQNGQLQMIPWDYNLAFGGFQSGDDATGLVNYPIDSPVSGGNVEDRPMIAWIFANEEYTEQYHQYFSEFIAEYFDSGYFENMIENVVSMISPYVEKDPTRFCTYEEFETGIATLKKFCLLRAQSISGQLDGTIGSTSDTQKSATLIDAGDLQINDMGSMNNSMGGGEMARPEGNMQMPQGDTDNGPPPFSSSNQDTADDTFAPTSPDDTTTQTPGDNMQGSTVPEKPNSDNGFPDKDGLGGQAQQPGKNGSPANENQMETPVQEDISVTSWMWLAISTAILVLGLVFAFVYKKRK